VSATSASESFAARAARGTLWTALRYLAEYAIRLGSNLVLTRLLFPEAFGLMALVNALMTGLAMFSDVGLVTSVVQSPHGDEPRFLRTAFTLQVLRGALLFVVAIVLASGMAWFYEQPELRALIAVTALTALVGGFNSVSLMHLRRRMALGRLAALELTAQVLGTAVLVAWAWVAPSVWALVGGGVVASGIKLAASYALGGRDASGFAWDRPAARHLLGFGKWIFLSTLLFFLAGQADRLLFGKLFPVALLGVYGVALVIAGLPTQLIWNVGNFVLLPAFSRHAQSSEQLERTYGMLQLPVLLTGVLPAALLIATGPELIELLYDPRYHDAGWMVQLLALGTWFQMPQTLSGNALLALGRPHWMAIGNGAKFLAMLVLVPAGFLMLGVPGAIAGLAGAEAGRWVAYAAGARRHGLPGWLPDLRATLLVAVAGVGGLAVARWLHADGVTTLPRLGAALGTVFVVWGLATAALLQGRLPELWAQLRDTP
jgi:O-antigen/teichoic acid export membrane protein